VTWCEGSATANRRTELEIGAAILAAMLREKATLGRSRKTRVQSGVYMNWKTFEKHLQRLARQGLISLDGLEVTERGKAFLREYERQLRPTLVAYGFVPSGPP